MSVHIYRNITNTNSLLMLARRQYQGLVRYQAADLDTKLNSNAHSGYSSRIGTTAFEISMGVGTDWARALEKGADPHAPTGSAR